MAIKLIEIALSCKHKGREYLWGAPYYNTAKISFKYMCRLLPEKIGKPNKSELSIYFPSNESTIYFKGVNTDPENTIEGNAYHHIVLDECSKMVEQAYTSCRTTTTKTQGQIDLITTPRGKNWVYKMYLKGLDPTETDFVCHNFKTSDNPYIDKAEIAKNKASLPERSFQQYFLGMFVDNSAVFTSYHQCLYDFDYEKTNEDNELWLSDTESSSIILGVDWGKVNDSTVITAWNYETKTMVGFRRFRGYDYITAVKELIRFNNSYENVEMIFHDKTGVGVAMDDLLAQTDLNYEGIVFTNNSKTDMVNDMIFAFERNDIKIPNWSTMKMELDSFEVQSTKTGKFTYNAFEGMHDDIVCSMMLGVHCLQEYATDFSEVISIDEISKLKLKKGDYFDKLESEYLDDEIWGTDDD